MVGRTEKRLGAGLNLRSTKRRMIKMTELTLYKCDICGKTFEDEAECREHEIEEKYGNNILAWAWSCNVNTPMQFPWPEEKWCEINILRFDTWEAYQFAYQLIETWGYCPPEVKKKTSKTGSLLFFGVLIAMTVGLMCEKKSQHINKL